MTDTDPLTEARTVIRLWLHGPRRAYQRRYDAAWFACVDAGQQEGFRRILAEEMAAWQSDKTWRVTP